MAYSLEDLDRLAKWWNNGQQKVKEEMAKSSLPAPKYGNTVPTLEEVSRRKLAEGTDSASMSLKRAEKEKRNKELNNVAMQTGTNSYQQYSKRYNLDTSARKEFDFDAADKRIKEIQAKGTSATIDELNEMDKLFTQAQEAGERQAIKDKSDAEMKQKEAAREYQKKNADRIAESKARETNRRNRIESEVKAIQNKGDMASMEEMERLNSLLNLAEKKGYVEKEKKDYLVPREKYEQMKQSTNLEKDIAPLAVALSTDAATRGRGTRAIQEMGYNSVNDYVQQMSRRYELTPDEVKDVVKTYQSDKTREQEQLVADKMYSLGRKHPGIGGAISALNSPASGVEGWYNNLANMTTGDDRNQSNLLGNITNESKRGGAESFNSPGAQNIYNFAVGGAGMALNAQGGLPAIAAMGGNTANEAMNSAIARGISPEQAAAYGMTAGLGDTVFNAMGFNAIDDALKSQTVRTVGDVLRNLGVGATTEAMENVAQDLTQTVADEIINGQDSELRVNYQAYLNNGMSPDEAFQQVAVDYAKQMGASAATGAFGGAIFGGIGMGKDYTIDRINYDNLLKRASAIDSKVRAYKESQVPTIDETNKMGIEAESAPINNMPVEEVAPRSYKDLMPKAPYFEADNYKEISNNLKTVNSEIDNLKNSKTQLEELLTKEVIGEKPEEEWTYQDLINSMGYFGRKPKIYTEEGNKIKESITNIDSRLKELYAQQSELREEQASLKKEASMNQRANYAFTKPQAATQTEYEGFDITKATHNDEVQDAINSGKAFIAEMSPLEYLQRSAYEIFNDSTLENTIRSANSFNQISEYADAMRNGEKFPILDLRYDSKSGRGQEGLTRALAAYEAGIDKVPVAIIGTPSENPYNSSLRDYEFDKRMSENPLTDEDIDNALLNMSDEDLREAAGVPRVGESPSLLAETPSQAEINTQRAREISLQAMEEDFRQGERASKRNNDTELDDMITDVYQRGNNLDNDEVYSDDFKNLNRLAQVIEQVKSSDAYAEGRQSTQLSMDNVPFSTIRAEDGTHLLDATDNLGLSTVNIDDIDKLTDYFKSEYNRLSAPTKTPNKVMAEDIGLNPRTKLDDEEDDGYTITEEVEPGKGYKENGLSQFGTNSLVNSKVLTPEEIENIPTVREMLEVTKGSESESFNTGLERMKEGDKWIDDYNSGKAEIKDANDIDTMMLGFQTLDARLADAEDDATRNALLAKKNMLIQKGVEATHRGGQFLQALVKWNRTSPEAAMLNAERLASERIKDAYGDGTDTRTKTGTKTRESKQIDTTSDTLVNKVKEMGNRTIAQALSKINDGTIQPKEKKSLTHEEIKQGVWNEIQKEFGSVSDRFNDSAIEYLTTLAENGVSADIIADEIVHYLNHGEFFTIDESLPVKKKMSGTLASVLRNMGNDSLKEANKPLDNGYPKKSHATIVEEVRNTLETEYAGLGLDSDTDIEFIATMIEEGVPKWQIEDEINHRLTTGEWYTLDESTRVTREKSSKLVRAFREQGDKTPKKEKPEIGFAKRKERIINTLEDEFGSIDGLFTDEAINQLVDFEERLTTSQLIDEIEHYLQHGEFYEITEDAPKNLPKMGALTNMLDRISGIETPKAERVPDTFEQTLEKVRNTLESENSSFAGLFNEDDYRFIATMFQEGVPKWQIEDELRYKLEHGEWYKIEEATPEAKPQNQKLRNALNDFVKEDVEPAEKPEVTLDEIKQQVRNTLDADMASLTKDFTDADYDYIANLLKSGVSKADLSNALKRRFVTGKWGISEEAMEMVNDTLSYAQTLDMDSRARVEAEMRAYQILADEIYGRGGDFKDKFDAWRYLAMLGNPKTHVRNIVGNTLFQGVTGISNNMAAVMEQVADKRNKKKGGTGINRTKAVLNYANEADRALVKASLADSDKTYRRWSGNKWNENLRDTIESQRKIFKGKRLNAINDANSNLLDIEDNMAMKNKYMTSLAGYLKGNGEDASIFNVEDAIKQIEDYSKLHVLDAETTAELKNLKERRALLEKARDYAIDQAKYSAFHEDNAVADSISKLSADLKAKADAGSKGAKLVHYMLEGMLPFKKTPANILKSGIDYSPLHAIDSLKKLRQYQKGLDNVDLSDVFDSMSKTLTGSMIMGLGMLLYNKGILQSSTNDEYYQDQLEGKQNYSLRIGDKTYTIDFAAPAVMPLLLGAEVVKVYEANGKDISEAFDALKDSDWEQVANDAVDLGKAFALAGTNLASPLVETSMLEGLNNTLESVGKATAYGGNIGNALGSLALNTGTSYFTSAIPTLSGQIARTIDNTRRSTYSDVPAIGKPWEKLQNKIPGLSMLNEPYIDAAGRQQKNSPTDNILGRALYQMLSPSYIADVKERPGDVMTREVYDSMTNKDAKIFSDWKSSKKINNRPLTSEEYRRYTEARGDADTEIRNYLADDEWFNGLSADKQADILKSISTLTDKIGEKEIEPNTELNKAAQAYEGGMKSLMEYFKGNDAKAQTKEMTGGLSDSSKLSKSIQEDIKKGDTKSAEKKAETYNSLSDYGLTKPGVTETYNYAVNNYKDVPSLDEFAKTYKKIDTNSNQGVTQDELISYLNRGNYSMDEANKLWRIYGVSTWKKVPALDDNGKWYKKAK